jgi:hypothetical protein
MGAWSRLCSCSDPGRLLGACPGATRIDAVVSVSHVLPLTNQAPGLTECEAMRDRLGVHCSLCRIRHGTELSITSAGEPRCLT